MRIYRFIVPVICTISVLSINVLLSGQQVEWVRQIGSTEFDEATCVAAEGLGNVYVAGRTNGTSDSAEASFQGFGIKLTDQDEFRWSTTWGTVDFDGNWLFVEDEFNDTYATGDGLVYFAGTFGGSNRATIVATDDRIENDTDIDEFTHPWTASERGATGGLGNAVTGDDDGNIYMVGQFRDNVDGFIDVPFAAVFKYDSSGNKLLEKQIAVDALTGSLDSFEPIFTDVKTDSFGNIFVAGNVFVSAANNGAGFVSKLSLTGDVQWTRFFDSPGGEEATAVAVDSLDNVYVTGWTTGELPDQSAGDQSELQGFDYFVAKFDNDGNEIWTRQFGLEFCQLAYDMTIDSSGMIYVCGYYRGNGAAGVAFVQKLNAAGTVLWTHEFGGAFITYRGVAVDDLGNVYATGLHQSPLPPDDTPPVGQWDGFLVKINQPLLGDVNLDGTVNLLDVAPFVDLVSSSEYQIEADTNQDGNVNLLDVDPFVGLISGS